MTATLATKYVICAQERISGEYLHLVDDVTVQVGDGVPYEPRNFPNRADIAPKSTVYPLRISFKSYMCSAISVAVTEGHNCAANERPKATGFCTKTTFGDWYCNASSSNTAENWEYEMPPPGGAKTAAAADAKDKPVVAKDNKQPAVTKSDADENKGKNNLPKPDFSEMEKWYEIVKYEYGDLAANDTYLYYWVKLKTDTAPTSFYAEYYDKDGVASTPKMAWCAIPGMSEGSRVGKLIKCHALTPYESEMEKVVSVKILRDKS